MAFFFVVLAVIVGVVLGDAVVENTGPGSVVIFNQTYTGLTQGQLMVVAAALGFMFALFLFFAWSSSVNRRAKRRERRLVQRDLQGRLGELERENTGLRNELDQTGRTDRVSTVDHEPGTDPAASEPVLPMRDRETVPHDGERASLRDRFRRGDRVEEPARPER